MIRRIKADIIHLWAKVTSVLYRGSHRYCPCCDKSFDKFKNFNGRSDALCPYCLSLERTRVLKLYLEKIFFINYPNSRVLHMAPERCLIDFIREKSTAYIDADIDPDAASHLVDITDIPFPDASIDLIICSHILAHVKDEAKAISEMTRVLRSGGLAIVMTYIYNLDTTIEDLEAITAEHKLSSLGRPDIWRKHGKDFVNRLASSGTIVKEFDMRSTLDHKDIAYMGLGSSSREKLFLLIKE